MLGYDAYSGGGVPFLATAAPDWPDKVRAPRVYGFHATLKPPFRLAANTTVGELTTAFDAFARSRQAVDVGSLQVRALGAFIALTPAAPCPALDRLATASVRAFDRFRAPMNERERERRLAAALSARQTDNLDRWGYPYVFDDFRFHMTLTGPLREPDRARALEWLTAEFAARPEAQHLTLDRLALARQDGGAFQVARIATLNA